MFEINKLQQEYLFSFSPRASSFFIRLKQSGDIWLFNCFEGCQHSLVKQQVKLSQIRKIIITDNHINSLSGLLGLLSSISLNTKIERLDLFVSTDFYRYLFWGRKYSQTNYRYKIYIHTALDCLLMAQLNAKSFIFKIKGHEAWINYLLILTEQPGAFNTFNAKKYRVPFGPLYGSSKLGKSLILPDGFILSSKNFIDGYYLGNKVALVHKSIKKYFIDYLSSFIYLYYY